MVMFWRTIYIRHITVIHKQSNQGSITYCFYKAVFSITSLIILFIGIMLSYIIFSKKGERYIIAGVLFSVGVHFIPFDTMYTYILAIIIMVNAISVFFNKNRSIIQVCCIDAMLKILLGVYLIFYL